MKLKKNDIKKQVLIGFTIGIMATAIGFYLYTQAFNNFSVRFIKQLIFKDKLLGLLLIYAAIPNLLTFFIFTKRKEDYKAKGVLMATMLIAVIILISKFVL